MRKRSSTLPRLPLPNISLSVGIAAPILLARTPACMLANEQMPAAMNRQATLLLSCLGLHEPHVRPANGLADCLCVSGIVLLPFHVGLHIGRRHEPDLVTKRLQFTRPVVRRRADVDLAPVRQTISS